MDDENGRGNQRRRARQIDEEDDRRSNRRRHTTNQMMTNAHAAAAVNDDDDDGPLSLSLGPTPYSSQIPPPTMMTTTTTAMLRLAPPSPFPPLPMMTSWSSSSPSSPHDFMASYQSYLMTSSSPYQAMSNSLYQTGSRGPMQHQPPPPPPPPPPLSIPLSLAFNPPPPPLPPPVPSSEGDESRRRFRSVRKEDTIPPPFPWATNKRGWIQSLEYLESKRIVTITGDVQCKHCEKVYKVSYNLRERFSQVESIFLTRKRIMRERAPPFWTNPEPVRCEFCGRDKAVKPVIADRKCQINWLFLLLGQTLGHCTLEQLKNFCKHSKSHRTGAKDRVLYLTYLGLCKMLEPNRELFNRDNSRR